MTDNATSAGCWIADVATGTDASQLVALPALLYSIYSSLTSGTPYFCLRTHVLLLERTSAAAVASAQQRAQRAGFGLSFHSVRTADHKLLRESSSTAEAMNMIRFYLPHILPNVDKVLWVDVDLIVRCDVRSLLQNTFLGKFANAGLAAVQRRSTLTKKIPNLTDVAMLRRIGSHKRVRQFTNTSWFNAGVAVFNLQVWRKEGIVADVELLVPWLRKYSLSRYTGLSVPGVSSQIPLVLLFSAFSGRFQALPRPWNHDGFAVHKNMASFVKPRQIDRDCVWHWSGRAKAWKKKAYNRDLWEPYSKNATASGFTHILEPMLFELFFENSMLHMAPYF